MADLAHKKGRKRNVSPGRSHQPPIELRFDHSMIGSITIRFDPCDMLKPQFGDPAGANSKATAGRCDPLSTLTVNREPPRCRCTP